MSDEEVADRRTTVSLMAQDLLRLQLHQRRASAARGEWIPMPQLVHELLDAVERMGEGA